MKITDITIEQFMYITLLVDTYKDNENKLNSEVIKYLFGTLTIEQKVAEQVLKDIAIILHSVPDFATRFTFEGVEYGFIPNLEEITTGEFIDLDEYIKDGKQLHKIAAILYRPITKKFGELYQIEPYEGTQKYDSVMKKVSYQIAVGAQVFFWNLSATLSNLMDTYTETQMKQEIQRKSRRK